MSDKRDRIGTVLRVRRVQELQAAGEMARVTMALRESERVLSDLHIRYDARRVLDGQDGLVPERLGDRTLRVLDAEAIQRGRENVRSAVALVESRRNELLERTRAVKAMERLDERLAEEELVELRRQEVRELDERGRPAASILREVGR